MHCQSNQNKSWALRPGFNLWSKRPYQPILVLTSALVLSACGGGDGDDDNVAGKCVPGVQTGFKAAIGDQPIPLVTEGEGEGGGGDGGGGGGEGNGVGGGDGQYRNVAVTIEDASGRTYGPATVDDEKGMVTFVHCNEPQLPARVTFEGKSVDATYYDEGLEKDVSFFDKRRIGLITNLAVNTGVTPLSEALYQRAQEIGRLQGVADGWKNATIVGQAQAELLAVINDQLPGIYRLTDLKRLPNALSEQEDQVGTNALPDNQNGIYGALLAGLAKSGATTLPDSTSPALDVAEALILDLRDATLNLKDANGELVGEADKIPYSYDSLWTLTSVSTGEAAQKTGSGSLLTASVPLAYLLEENAAAGIGEAELSRYVLESNGELTVEVTTGGTPQVQQPTAGVKYSKLMRFPNGAPGESVVMALRQDGSSVRMFPLGSDGSTSSELTPPNGNNFVELMDGGSPVLRLSDGSFVRWDGANGFNVEPVPEGVVNFTFRVEYAGALDNDETALGPDTNGADDNGLCIGTSRTGKVKLWRPVFSPGDTIPAQEPEVDEIVQASSNQDISLGLTATGAVYHLDANHSVRFLEPGGAPATELSGDETRELIRPQAAPVLINELPKICSLRAPYAIACGGAAYRLDYPAYADQSGAVQGAGPISGVTALPIPAPVWRTIVDRGGNLAFIGTDGKAYSNDGNEIDVSL